MIQAGYEVTGLDFVEDLVKLACKNASGAGLELFGLVQEISRLELSENSFDVVWFSSGGYSMIPTRERRVQTLERIGSGLTQKGRIVCQFFWDQRREAQARYWFEQEVRQALLSRLQSGEARAAMADLSEQVARGDLTPAVAAERMLRDHLSA